MIPVCNTSEKNERLERILLKNLHARLLAMRELLEEVNRWNCYENYLYKFYAQSFKVFEGLQGPTEKIVDLLTESAPEGWAFNEVFQQIIAAGVRQKFGAESNEHWVESAGPVVTAFLHARFFLKMAVKYAVDPEKPPQGLAPGWRAILALYHLYI